jgi:CubicO group peptidase (beta-lactamase class C family)
MTSVSPESEPGILTAAVDRLLGLGDIGRRPVSAVIGIRAGSTTSVRTGGWAVLPGTDTPGVPMSRGLALDLASVTKVASTTTIVLRLVAEGHLQLDAPARTYLPAFRGGSKDRITVGQLLTHTAGLQQWWPLYCEVSDRESALKRAQTLPLATDPGTTWSYSDLGLILVGLIIERVTTLDLAAAFRQLVAEPLSLTASYGPIPAERAVTSADSDVYEYGMVATRRPYPVPFTVEHFAGWRNRSLRGEVNDGNAAHALGGVAGHAGLFGTVDDLLQLGAALRDGVFSKEVLARFATPSAVHPEQAIGFRRMQLQTARGPLTLLHHGGFTGTFFAFGIERPLVVAGAAMRLYGTVGRIPAPVPDRLVQSSEIQAVLLDSALQLLDHDSLDPATASEER